MIKFFILSTLFFAFLRTLWVIFDFDFVEISNLLKFLVAVFSPFVSVQSYIVFIAFFNAFSYYLIFLFFKRFYS